jgi:putative FmdB family regulatory protein
LKARVAVANFNGLRTLRRTRQMPTYEYRCPEGHEFEDFVLKMSDAKSELPCPTCGVVAARRMSAGSGLLFKGSGFYITDYGKDGKKDQRAAASKSEAAASAPAKSDAAPAAKPASTPAPAASSSSTPKSGPAK